MTFAPFRREGAGVHTGARGVVTIHPCAESRGIVFATAHGEIPFRPESLASDARGATDLVAGEARVRTVEHLVAALAWFGVGGARIDVVGPEIPILDGSALPWCEALLAAGASPVRRFWRPLEPAVVDLGSSRAEMALLGEGESPRLEVEIDFGDRAVGPRRAVFRPLEDDFVSRIAPARTFAFADDVAALHGAELALGGSLSCALVLGDRGPMNPEGMRFSDEPARHKLLDALGDLSLLGGLPWAILRLYRPGHALNRALVAKVQTLVAP